MSRTRNTLAVVACVLFVACLTTGAASAQILGTINGYISASNGDALPGVTVTVTNQDTGVARSAITGADGFYIVRSLPSGTYSVTGALEGMQTTRQEDVLLLVGQQIGIDLTMGVATQEEVITVTADTPLIEVSRSSAASYIREEEIENIPVAGRDFKQFALLAPTVNDDPQRGFISMSGQRGIYSGLRIDGTSGKNAFFGYGNGGEATENDGLVIGQESVKEFQVITNGFNPEYGLDGGGFVNVVTRSGSNEIKGSAFAFYTDDSLSSDIPASDLDRFRDPNARDFEPSEFERKNWGATIGGPIKRDRVHYFFSYDQTDRTNPFIDRLRTRGAYDAVLQRAQDNPAFADLVADYTPNDDGIAAPDPINGRTASGVFNRNVDNIILLGKVDFAPNAQNNVSLRYNYTDYERTSTFRDEESLKQEEVNTIVGSWVYVPNDQSVVDSRLQYATDDLNRGNLRVGTPIEALIRFRGRDGSSSDQVGKFDFLPIVANTEAIEFRSSYSYLFGEHDLKFGIDYASDNMQQIFAGSKDGRYDFNTIEDFLNNNASQVRIYFGNVQFPNYDETQEVSALFAQDSWRPNDNLTINYGLRYERTDNPDNIPHVLPEGRDIPDDDHIAPRLGFVWQISPERGDVLRGGFGVFYGRTPTLLFASQVQENGIYPNYGRITVRPGQTGFVPLGTPIDNENPPVSTIPSTSFLDPAFKDAKNTRINLGYEIPIGRNWSAGADLLYAEGKNNQRNFNDNLQIESFDAFGRPQYSRDLPNPNFNTIFVRRSIGESEYRAATLKVTRRYTGRYTFQAHYTNASDEDDDSNERNATDVTVSNLLDPSYDYGTSYREVEHRFVAFGVVDLPAGFRIGGTFKFQSGSPYTAIDANQFGAGCPTTVCPAPRAVINGQLVGRNTFQNDDWTQFDLRLGWNGDLGNAGSIEIFAEAFNLFDEKSFAVNSPFNQTLSPFNTTSQQEPLLSNGNPNPEFGIGDNRVLQPRRIQFGARYRF